MLKTLALFSILILGQNASPRLLPYPHSLWQPQAIAHGTQGNASSQENHPEDRSRFILATAAQGNEETNDNKGKTPSNPNKAWTTSDKIAVGACIAGFLQFLALIATIWTMRRFSKSQLRAYVLPNDLGMIEGMQLDPPRGDKRDTPGIVLTIKNTGQTPAYKVKSWAQIDVILIQNERQLSIPRLEDKSVHTLGSGDVTTKLLWYDRPLSVPEMEDIKNGTRAIYVYGRVEYRDAFGKKRFTNYRLLFTEKMFPPVGNPTFNYCHTGNDAN